VARGGEQSPIFQGTGGAQAGRAKMTLERRRSRHQARIDIRKYGEWTFTTTGWL